MKSTKRAGYSAISVLGALILPVSNVLAGPIPGVNEQVREPVDFPVPQSVEAWRVGDEEYAVVFQWLPEESAETASVAGTFNSWNATASPMTGPDADGIFTVELELPAGVYQYKFVANGENWFLDPRNPQTGEMGNNTNSVLRLGAYAIVGDSKAVAGDGKIEPAGFRHNQTSPMYYDNYSRNDLYLRFRTVRDDVETVAVRLSYDGGATMLLPTVRVASDDIFDYYEGRLYFPAEAQGKRPERYTFVLTDGETELETPESYVFDYGDPTGDTTPQWARHATWYQVMIDRFRDGNPKNNPEYTKGSDRPEWTADWTSSYYALKDGTVVDIDTMFSDDSDGDGFPDIWGRLYGGDFEGLIEKLDYIKELGATAIYLNPVFEATSSHKYNGKSYVHADDGYGVPGEFAKSTAKESVLDPSSWEFNESDKMLLRVIEEIHARDMRVIFDGVFNHLGDQAPTFTDVVEKGMNSLFIDWYELDSVDPVTYTGWAGFPGLPQFRKDPKLGLASAAVRHHVYEVTRRWMDPNGDGDPSDGIDGWRLDVPMDVPRPFWVEWRQVVKSINPDAYITGEIWDPAEYWLDGETFDAVMNYPLAKIAFKFFGNRAEKISASEFDRQLGRHRIRYSRAHTLVLQNLFDSHDTDRWASRLNNPDLSYDDHASVHEPSDRGYDESRPPADVYRRVELMAAFQATYVGAPMIWYGTEVGMYGADDPFTRRPMWWEDLGEYDDPDYWPDTELRATFTELLNMRQEFEVLRTGDYLTLVTDDEKDVIVYLRYAPDSREAIVAALNNSAETQEVAVGEPGIAALRDGFNDAAVVYGKDGTELDARKRRLNITIPGTSAVIVSLRN